MNISCNKFFTITLFLIRSRQIFLLLDVLKQVTTKIDLVIGLLDSGNSNIVILVDNSNTSRLLFRRLSTIAFLKVTIYKKSILFLINLVLLTCCVFRILGAISIQKKSQQD